MQLRRTRLLYLAFVMTLPFASARAQTKAPAPPGTVPQGGDKLLGGYGPYRANNDLLYYNLHVRVDPAKQFLSGMNAIRFRMLEDGTRIQIDLVPAFQIDGIALENPHGTPTPLKYNRAAGRTYRSFPSRYT